MSTWTGGTAGSDDAYSDTRCRWQMCTAYVPYRFLNQNMHLSREHALWVWSVVNDQIEGADIPETEPPIMRDKAPAPPTPEHVYYIRTGGRIKIGHTTNLWQRLAVYPPDMEVLYVQTGTKELERSEHRRFRMYLADGREWFQDRPEVTEPIEEMASSREWKAALGSGFWRRRTRQATYPAPSR